MIKVIGRRDPRLKIHHLPLLHTTAGFKRYAGKTTTSQGDYFRLSHKEFHPYGYTGNTFRAILLMDTPNLPAG